MIHREATDPTAILHKGLAASTNEALTWVGVGDRITSSCVRRKAQVFKYGALWVFEKFQIFENFGGN